MIDFPTSPVVNDAYTFGSRTWIWNGSGWERQINRGQTVSVFVQPGTEVYETVTGLPITVSFGWYQLNYV